MYIPKKKIHMIINFNNPNDNKNKKKTGNIGSNEVSLFGSSRLAEEEEKAR